MADALKCDKCKTFYDRYSGLPFTKNGPSYNGLYLEKKGCWGEKRFDLCPKCMEQVIDFLRNDKEA